MTTPASPQGKEEKFCTYKVYDPDIQKIIYVGMTSNLQRRIKEHGHNSKWWKPVLRFDAIKENMEREEAKSDEKRWIRYYSEKGHPLVNSTNNPNMDTDRFMVLTWLGSDTENPGEEMEQVVQYFFRGREALNKRDEEDIVWRNDPTWDRIYFAVRAVALQLDPTLSELDIARLTAKAVGMNIDSEVME